MQTASQCTAHGKGFALWVASSGDWQHTGCSQALGWSPWGCLPCIPATIERLVHPYQHSRPPRSTQMKMCRCRMSCSPAPH